MTNLSFLGGAVLGLAMSSALWFGLTVFWEAVTNRTPSTVEAPAWTGRSAAGVLFVAVALLPAFFMYRDESWSALQGYAAGAAGFSILVFIELIRGAK